MGYYFPNVDPLYLYKRQGTAEDPFIPLQQDLTVKYTRVTLKEIPDFTTKVTVTDPNNITLTEVTTDTLQEQQYRVDYSTGNVFFHASAENIKMHFSYLGTGYVNIGADRLIVDTSDTNGEALSVQDILDEQGNINERLTQASSDMQNIENQIQQNHIITEQEIGDLTALQTTAKDTIVNAVNETVDDINKINEDIGDLTGLHTDAKDNLVDSINEQETKIENIIERNKDIFVNVKEDFGAVGDGVTDDTQAFVNAISFIKANGGGTLFIPTTVTNKYLLKDAPVLCDNIRILSSFATLKKDGTCNNYYIFKTLSNGKTGYGSGASNIIFEGVRFEGSFADSRGASITLHHSSNITFRKCIFSQCVISGHAIDMGGCSDVLIEDCVFEGFSIQTGREYVEAIQIDNSYAQGTGTDTADSYDGLATRNVTVTHCKFLPLTLNGITYPAPNPMGSHARVATQWFTNIRFIGNYVEDAPYAVTDTSNGASNYAIGWLHFYHIDGLTISDNKFINKSGVVSRVLGLYTMDTAILMSDIADPNAVAQAYTSQPCKNIKFERNRIEGFKNTNNIGIIYLQGRLYNTITYNIENISISDNDWINCYDVNTAISQSNYNICSDLISASYVNGLNIYNNRTNGARRILYGTNINKIQFNHNNLKYVYWNPLNVSNSNYINAHANILDGCGAGFYFVSSSDISVKDNQVENDDLNAHATYGAIVQVKSSSNLIIKDNILQGVSGTPYTGIMLYTSCSNGIIKDNLISNFAATSISTDSANIITQ